MQAGEPTFQKKTDQWSTVTVFGLVNQKLPIIQHSSDRVTPLDNAIRYIACIILLIGPKCLQVEEKGMW